MTFLVLVVFALWPHVLYKKLFLKKVHILQLKPGLTENEIRIYTALLKLATASPVEIAEKTGFSRSYVYDALERMTEKEMVSSVLRKGKKHYTAADPRRLEELAKQRLEKIQNIIPKLKDLQKISKEEIKVELHRGAYVYKTLLKRHTCNTKEKQ